MPCEGCGENKEYDLVKLRFIGGIDASPTGPYIQYETGKIYEVSTRLLNKEAYPFWEPVTEEDLESERKVPPFLDDDEEECIECDEEEEETITSTDKSQDDVTISIEEKSSPGLSIELGQEGTMREIVTGMDVTTLRGYIQGNGGKVDNRWGRKRLIEEALKS